MPGTARASTVRVLLIGSDSEGAERIRSLLAVVSMTFEVSDAPTMAGAVDLPDLKECDVILLDTALAAGDGMSLLARVRTRMTEIPVVVLGECDDEALALRAIHAGAHGYLLKSELSARLLATTLAAAVGIQTAILQLNESRERERHLVTHDQLTGLANRALLKERLSQAIAAARRSREKVALLVVNLDGFKEINGQLGHAVGDGLLRGIAQQILGSLRETDTAGRLSSDEFAVLLTQLSDESGVATGAEKVLRAVGKPRLFTASVSTTTTASVGVATFPRDGCEPEDLLRKADIAM